LISAVSVGEFRRTRRIRRIAAADWSKRDKVKLDEFAAAVETAKNLAETKHFQTVYEK
jgi:hypothetical protein